jgi:hypothetical protein
MRQWTDGMRRLIKVSKKGWGDVFLFYFIFVSFYVFIPWLHTMSTIVLVKCEQSAKGTKRIEFFFFFPFNKCKFYIIMGMWRQLNSYIMFMIVRSWNKIANGEISWGRNSFIFAFAQAMLVKIFRYWKVVSGMKVIGIFLRNLCSQSIYLAREHDEL